MFPRHIILPRKTILTANFKKITAVDIRNHQTRQLQGGILHPNVDTDHLNTTFEVLDITEITKMVVGGTESKKVKKLG